MVLVVPEFQEVPHHLKVQQVLVVLDFLLVQYHQVILLLLYLQDHPLLLVVLVVQLVLVNLGVHYHPLAL